MLEQDRVTPQHIDSLAAAISRFHTGLPVSRADSPFGSPTTVRAAAMQNFGQLLAQLPAAADRASVAELQAATESAFSACAGAFETRRRQGCVRECHGDLHLGNIVLAGDLPVPFDGIEFNPALRWIDVMDEIAFPVMDLQHRDRPDFAWRLLNACLEMSGDYHGIAVLRFYLAYRAAVRAKVSAIRSRQAGLSPRERSDELVACRSYLALARQYLERRRPSLILTHGLPGSGKTTFSQMLLQQTGAIRLRSDVERKRLFGLGALDSSREGVTDIYSPAATRRTYARLLALAREMLEAGFSVVVDAAFLRLDERESFRELAQQMSVPFAIASLYAGEGTLRERIRQRRYDASEADVGVLERLKASQHPLSARELEYTARFTTEEAPDSRANRRAWARLAGMPD